MLLDSSGPRWLTTCNTDTFTAFTGCELGQLDPMSAAERVQRACYDGWRSGHNH